MKKEMIHAFDVFFSEYLTELKKEVDYHKNGGTTYRKASADLALNVASKVGKMTPFLNREEAKNHVKSTYPELDTERIQDVGKMLHVIARELSLNHTRSEEVKKYVQLKQSNRNPLNIKKQ